MACMGDTNTTNKAVTKLKITMSTNKLASNPREVERLIPGLFGALHNGGKTVIALVNDVDLGLVKVRLDRAHQVAAYEER